MQMNRICAGRTEPRRRLGEAVHGAGSLRPHRAHVGVAGAAQGAGHLRPGGQSPESLQLRCSDRARRTGPGQWVLFPLTLAATRPDGAPCDPFVSTPSISSPGLQANANVHPGLHGSSAGHTRGGGERFPESHHQGFHLGEKIDVLLIVCDSSQ